MNKPIADCNLFPIFFIFSKVTFKVYFKLSIIKDLTDFVAIGKDFGLSGDQLFKYANEEYEKYIARFEHEKQDEEKHRLDEEKRFERKMGLLDR